MALEFTLRALRGAAGPVPPAWIGEDAGCCDLHMSRGVRLRQRRAPPSLCNSRPPVMWVSNMPPRTGCSAMPKLRDGMSRQCARAGLVPVPGRPAMSCLRLRATCNATTCFWIMPSTVIRRYQYDADTRQLDILFVSGEAYSYFDVPESIVEGLRNAPSKGRYFQSHIRDKFTFRRDRTRG